MQGTNTQLMLKLFTILSLHSWGHNGLLKGQTDTKAAWVSDQEISDSHIHILNKAIQQLFDKEGFLFTHTHSLNPKHIGYFNYGCMWNPICSRFCTAELQTSSQ